MNSDGPKGPRQSSFIAGVVAIAVFATAGTMGGIGFAGTQVSAAQYQYGKMTICHRTKSKKNPMVTINVSQNAVPAHLAHGDTQGACPNVQAKGKKAKPAPKAPPVQGQGQGQGQSNGNGQSKGKGKDK